MFGSRCSLCNGKLNSRKICKECGLDNSKSEKYYKINQSSCDNLPMTHVHEDVWQEEKSVRKKSKSVNQPRYSYQISQPQKKKIKKIEADSNNKKSTISVLITVLLIVIGAIPTVLGIFENETHTSAEPDYEEIYNPYEYLEQEHPLEGDTISYDLESGRYVVGVHIAPGNYWAEVQTSNDSVEITDNGNSIFLYTDMFYEEGMYLDDLRLFEGAIVTISAPYGIILKTDNAQTGEMSAMAENFVTDGYKMYGYDEAEAGIDFEPGIYDLTTDANYSYVNLTIYDEDGSEWDFRSFDLGSDGIHGQYFRNVVIPEGAVISCEDAGVELIPSEWIWTTDYMEHYY